MSPASGQPSGCSSSLWVTPEETQFQLQTQALHGESAAALCPRCSNTGKGNPGRMCSLPGEGYNTYSHKGLQCLCLAWRCSCAMHHISTSCRLRDRGVGRCFTAFLRSSCQEWEAPHSEWLNIPGKLKSLLLWHAFW